MADESPQVPGPTNRCTVYERKYDKQVWVAQFSKRLLYPIIEDIYKRRDRHTMLPEDKRLWPKLQALKAADIAYDNCVPENLRVVSIGLNEYKNKPGDFLVRPIVLLDPEEQVNIEAQKIGLRHQMLKSWTPVAKEMLKNYCQDFAFGVTNMIVKDIVDLERRLNELEGMDPYRMAKCSVEYALSSRELLTLTKPVRIKLDRSTGVYWEQGSLILPDKPPFITRRYSRTNMLKFVIDPMINNLLHDVARDTLLPGDGELLPLVHTYVTALTKHKERIPQNQTGIEITERGCHLVDYYDRAYSHPQSNILQNGPDDVIILPTSHMPLTEQVFLQEWKLETRMAFERAKHALAGELVTTRYSCRIEAKEALREDWKDIQRYLHADEMRGPRQLAIRMVAFAHAPVVPENPGPKGFQVYARLVNIDPEVAEEQGDDMLQVARTSNALV